MVSSGCGGEFTQPSLRFFLTFNHVVFLRDRERPHLAAVTPVHVVHCRLVDHGEANFVKAVGGEACDGGREALVLGCPVLVAPDMRGQVDIRGLEVGMVKRILLPTVLQPSGQISSILYPCHGLMVHPFEGI